MKKLSVSLISAMMAAQLLAAPALAEEPAKGTAVNYGFSIEAGNFKYAVDYNMIADANDKAALSADLTITEDENELNIPLENLVAADNETIYLNSATLVSAYESLTGDTSVQDMLSYLGVTEEWVALPLPEFAKIILPASAEVPEAPQAMSIDITALTTQLLPVIIDFMPTVDADGNTVLTINREKLLSAAQKIDEVIAQTGASQDSSSAAPENPLKGLDIKPAFEKYINAVAEGYAQADPQVSVEEATEMINQLIDSVMESVNIMIDSSLGAQASALQSAESMKLYDVLSQLLGNTEFELTLVVGSSNLTATLTMDGQSIVLTAGMGENGIELTLGDGENVYYTGAVEMTENGMVLTVTDTEQNELFTAELVMEENSYSLTASAGGEVLASIVATQEENGASLTVSSAMLPDSLLLGYEATEETGYIGYIYFGAASLYISVDGSLGETEGNGSIYVSASADETNTVNFYGYINYTESDETVEIPAACDGLDVITNIAKMYFESMSADAVAETE